MRIKRCSPRKAGRNLVQAHRKAAARNRPVGISLYFQRDMREMRHPAWGKCTNHAQGKNRPHHIDAATQQRIIHLGVPV
jgi:hypothetical protein